MNIVSYFAHGSGLKPIVDSVNFFFTNGIHSVPLRKQWQTSSELPLRHRTWQSTPSFHGRSFHHSVFSWSFIRSMLCHCSLNALSTQYCCKNPCDTIRTKMKNSRETIYNENAGSANPTSGFRKSWSHVHRVQATAIQTT